MMSEIDSINKQEEKYSKIKNTFKSLKIQLLVDYILLIDYILVIHWILQLTLNVYEVGELLVVSF